MANTTTGRETLGQTAESVAHMILDRVGATPNAEAFRAPLPDDSGWRSLTWKQTYDDAEKLAGGLLSLGLEPGAAGRDRVQHPARLDPGGHGRHARWRRHDHRLPEHRRR